MASALAYTLQHSTLGAAAGIGIGVGTTGSPTIVGPYAQTQFYTGGATSYAGHGPIPLAASTGQWFISAMVSTTAATLTVTDPYTTGSFMG